MSSSSIAERLKALRGNQTKANFARKLGISAPVYQRYEEGRIPRANILSVIAERCGVSIEQLIGDHPGLALHAASQSQSHGASMGHAAHAVREHPPPAYGTVLTSAEASTCRIPSGCDLPHELADVKASQHAMQTQLATLSAQVDTLTRLLGAALAPSAAAHESERKKAG